MTSKEDLLLKLFQMMKLNLNYAESRADQLDQIKSHTLSPMTVEQSDSHTQILKLMIQSRLILLLEQSLILLNSKLEMLSSPHQETTLEELVLLLQEKDIWEVLISSTFKMKEDNNSPPELAIFSSLVRERNPGFNYQKEMVSIYPQLKLKLRPKRKITRKRNTEKLIDCTMNESSSYRICHLLCSLFVMMFTMS